MPYIIGYLVGGIIFGCITAYLSRNKGYDGGFWWGFFLGFIGLIVVACRRDMTQQTYEPSPQQEGYLSRNHAEKETKSEAVKWTCLNCGAKNPASLTYCLNCRSDKAVDIPWKCTCGAKNKMTNTSCWVCGKDRNTSIKQNSSDETNATASEVWICGACTSENASDALFCKKCGRKHLSGSEASWMCTECRHTNLPDALFCIKCGQEKG